MVSEELIREAYLHLRKTNMSIPDETLYFMLEASLEKLNNKDTVSKIERLKDDYLRRYNTAKEMSILKRRTEEQRERAKIKASCYRHFLTELTR